MQVRELASFVNGATPVGIPALLFGDFNCIPGSREFEYLGYTLQWAPMLQKAWRDHICAHSLLGSYRFTPLEEIAIRGSVPVEGAAKPEPLSDHTGCLVRLRIEPQAASAANATSVTR